MNLSWYHYVFAVLLCASTARVASAVDTEWRSTVVTQARKERPAYYNSQRLALDRRGRPFAIYVTQFGNADTLCFSRSVGRTWREENVYTMEHSAKKFSGLNAYALALDLRDRPHVYIYSSDYRKSASVFEERWAYRATRGWQMHVMRHSENQLGGAAIHDPNLAIDGRGYLHVTGYAHAGYGTAHRVRHRFYDGVGFGIDALPRPPGKSDSHVANLFIDRKNVVHIVYDSTRALRSGNAEPNYPNASLVYIARGGRAWSSPELIVDRVGAEPSDTDHFVVSVGILVDKRDRPHVTYAISKRGKTDPTDIFYAYRDRDRWDKQHVATVASGSFRVSVSSPALDRTGAPHIAFDTPTGTMYAWRSEGDWKLARVDGDLEGFAMDPRYGVHVLTSSGRTLTHHFRPLR